MATMDLPLHPMLVHFPIALFISALGLEILARILQKDTLHKAAFYLFILATVATPFVVLTGLEEADEFHLVKHPVLNLHRNFAFLTMWTSFLGLLSLWFVQKRLAYFFRNAFLLFLFIIVGFTILTAYNGGRLVYEYGIGVDKE